MSPKEQFINLVEKYVKRPGTEDLLNHLEKRGFFDAPASKMYHGSYPGGLVEHSINVYYALRDVLTMIFGKEWTQRYSEETVAIVSLFHDVCKSDKYLSTTRNVKNKETGVWETAQVYDYNGEHRRNGHGSLSNYILMDFIHLSEDERQAIHWHMGAYDISQYNTVQDLANAWCRNTLAFALHLADMTATYIDENDKFVPIDYNPIKPEDKGSD
jgi:hypothetical protein